MGTSKKEQQLKTNARGLLGEEEELVENTEKEWSASELGKRDIRRDEERGLQEEGPGHWVESS